MLRPRWLRALVSALAIGLLLGSAGQAARTDYTGPVTGTVWQPDGTLPAAKVGVAYGATVTARPPNAPTAVASCNSHDLDGLPPPGNFSTFNDCATKLPPGLKATNGSTFRLTGVPTKEGRYYFDIMAAWKLENGALLWGKRTFELVVASGSAVPATPTQTVPTSEGKFDLYVELVKPPFGSSSSFSKGIEKGGSGIVRITRLRFGNSDKATNASPAKRMFFHTWGSSAYLRDAIGVCGRGGGRVVDQGPFDVPPLAPGSSREWPICVNTSGITEHAWVRLLANIGLPCFKEDEVTCSNNRLGPLLTVSFAYIDKKKTTDPVIWCKPRQKPTTTHPCREPKK